jgi:hypothetical protein
MPKRETVNHPEHYQAAGGLECIDVIEALELNFSLGSAMKYLWRAGKKHNVDGIEDLRKARWYLDREITRRES